MKVKVYKFLTYLLIFLVALICLFPPYVILITSLQIETQVFSIPAEFIPKPIQWSNYIDVWSRISLAKYLLNGLIVSVATIACTLTIACLAAYPLAQLNIPGKKLIMLSLLFTQMFAPPVVLLPLFRLFQQVRLLNTLTSLVIVNTTFSLAFATLLITGIFAMVPKEVLEAATIDGCHKMGILTRILLPVSSSGIFVVSIHVFTRLWNEFLFSFTFISSNSKMMPIVGLFNFLWADGTQLPPWNLSMAIAMIISLPALVLFYLQRDWLSKGLTAGAIK